MSRRGRRWSHGCTPRCSLHPSHASSGGQPAALMAMRCTLARHLILLVHDRRLRVALLPAPGVKHACDRLQRSCQRRHDDQVGAPGGAQPPDVLAKRARLPPAIVCQVRIQELEALAGQSMGGSEGQVGVTLPPPPFTLYSSGLACPATLWKP